MSENEHSETELREYLTITLTDRPPVRIAKDDWPIVASAKDWDNQHECQANRTWKLIVRKHADGRAIVYAIYSTCFQGEHDRRGGQLVSAGADIAAAIKTVGGSVLDCDENMIQRCISDLPAEKLS